MPQQRRRPGRERIVDAALALAERDGWEAVRLHQVAAACGGGLQDIQRHFREKDELIDAWLDRADAAMLSHADSEALLGLSPRERIRELVWAWLGALAGHRRVTREMIGHKLEFGHVHVQFPALLRISRTVQWIREGARLDAPLPRRAVEETALTGMFITTFVRWLWDESPGFQTTRRHLDGALATLEGLGRRVPGGRFGGDPVTPEAGGNAPDDGTAASAGPRASASPEGG